MLLSRVGESKHPVLLSRKVEGYELATIASDAVWDIPAGGVFFFI
jgi:hypothetical protein